MASTSVSGRERFFRSWSARSRQIPGTGLTLYISNSLVLAHGGLIVDLPAAP